MLSQFSHDPAGGAVRSLRTICEMLASSPDGAFRVAAIGTTATDHRAGIDARAVLREQGLSVYEERPADARQCATLRFMQRGIEYALLDTGPLRAREWHEPHGKQYDDALLVLLKRLAPHVVLTMGALPPERARQRLCREAGARVILGVRNHSYYDIRAFEEADDALMPSRFLVESYERRIGFRGTGIAPPLEPDDVVPDSHKPVCFTFVNPSPDKGVMFFARLADEIGARRGDIPLMVVESRGLAGTLVASGAAGGFDLRRHSNILVSPGVPLPKHFFSATRALLAPSVWEEPSGRVASEALLCGVPPIVSDRGGLPETCLGAGFVLPLPSDLTPSTRVPVEKEAVRAWLDVVVRLADDDAFYESSCAAAREAGKAYAPAALAPTYRTYFREMAQRPRRTNREGRR